MDVRFPEEEEMTASELFRQRRLILGVGASYALCSLLGVTARADPAQRILVMTYSGGFALDPNIQNLAHNLEGPGVIVTSSNWGPSAGELASLLQQNTFDQIYIWDLEINAQVANAADKAALAAWWNDSAAHRNVVLDSRAHAIFRDNDATELALCDNIVANLTNRGGGLWIGAGYAPDGARTANAYLAALDPNNTTPDLFQGALSNISAVTGSGNPVLTTPNVVDATGLAYSYLGSFSRSIAPQTAPTLGALATVIADAEGHRLITTNIPEPTGFMGMGAGGAALFAGRRRTERGGGR